MMRPGSFCPWQAEQRAPMENQEPVMQRYRSRIAVLLLIVLVVAAIKITGLDQYLSLARIQELQSRFMVVHQSHPLLVAALFFISYVVATALSIPGAVVLTLVAGAFFGLVWGTLLVSFASTMGATLAFLLARFLLRDWVQKKFADRLAAVNEGVAREGALYLFTMRLIPLFPFFVVNLVMGLTRIPVRTYFWVSQLGMLPGTIVYVNAGQELSRITSLSGIMSPRLLFAFALLGVMPLAARKAITWYRGQRAKQDQ